MQKLNLPDFAFSLKKVYGQEKILDIIRKKYVVLTPEEWVRQNVIHYFKEYLGVPVTLMAVEKSFKIGNVSKRFDIAVYDPNGSPVMLTECKSPDVSISQKVFDQAARYNMRLHVHYLFITNGLSHYGGIVDYKNQAFNYIKELPLYSDMIEKREL